MKTEARGMTGRPNRRVRFWDANAWNKILVGRITFIYSVGS